MRLQKETFDDIVCTNDSTKKKHLPLALGTIAMPANFTRERLIVIIR
jgi:hypothetical protein